jgi:hypothetical protein
VNELESLGEIGGGLGDEVGRTKLVQGYSGCFAFEQLPDFYPGKRDSISGPNALFDKRL